MSYGYSNLDKRDTFHHRILADGLRAEANRYPPELRIRLYWARAVEEMTDVQRPVQQQADKMDSDH